VGLKFEHIWPVLRRWLWLIILVGVIPPVVLGVRLKPTYSASARLQLTAPPAVQVAVYQQGDPYSNLRDELTVARIDFIEAAKSTEVRARAVAALALMDADAAYGLDVRQVRDSDFIDLSVEARTAELAQRTANAHAEAAIQYASELRALPARAAVAFLGERLRTAQAELEAAQFEAATVADQSRAEQMVRGAQEKYLLIQRKLNEAELKSVSSYSAQSMQVVARAPVPVAADSRKVQAQLMMSGLGGLVAGVLIAMLLDFVARKPVLRRMLPSRAVALDVIALLIGLTLGMLAGALLIGVTLGTLAGPFGGRS
jgi:uncharacterized protein involved in exopolysaccharide biosynthesis